VQINSGRVEQIRSHHRNRDIYGNVVITEIARKIVMAKKYYAPNPSIKKKNKKGKIISETVKAIANQDQFLSFNDINRLYKKLATQHNT
jgi:hypothetical protein